MCGIAGIFSAHPPKFDEILTRMQNSISHRGPDDSGIDIISEAGSGLAFARLAIIDLTSAGHQPMWNPNRSIALVFNGEVYNFKELRHELIGLGHRFFSKTDTEVILRGYEEWGIDIVRRLNGMFAIAILDMRPMTEHSAPTLYLVRDRLGQKPLYYWYNPRTKTLLFASEIKAILQYSQVERTVAPDALHCYLVMGYVPPPYTMFQGIRKLPAAHFLRVSHGGELHIKRYWEVPVVENIKQSKEEYQHHIRTLIEAAIKRRLISDVPLGAFLSGGIDSTIVVGVMSQLLKEPVRTFSTAFDVGPRSFKYNVDADMADLVSTHFKTNHTRFTITPEIDLIKQLRQIVYQMDEPHANATLVSTYLLSQAVKEHGITVILTGDGSDELFGGYPRYQLDWQLDWMAYVPQFTQQWLIHAAKYFKRAEKVAKGFEKANLPPMSAARYLTWWGLFDSAELTQYLNPSFSARDSALEHVVRSVLKNKGSFSNNQEAMCYTDLKLWIAEESNMRVDKMSMAHAVEARAPFLDYTVVEYAMKIPFRQKVGWGNYKKLLKETYSDLLPDFVLNRPKKGWFSPRHYWVNDFIWKEVQSAVRYLPQTGIFRPDICQLVEQHPTIIPQKLWTLMIFSLWYQIYVEETTDLSI